MGIAVQLHILFKVFDLNSVEIGLVGTVDHQRHPQAAECGCVHLLSKQLERLTATMLHAVAAASG